MQKAGKEAADAMSLDRTNDHTAKYAAACLSVAKELSIPCVDLFSKLQTEAVGELPEMLLNMLWLFWL